jgi:Na+-driven multidrug efflux pump
MMKNNIKILLADARKDPLGPLFVVIFFCLGVLIGFLFSAIICFLTYYTIKIIIDFYNRKPIKEIIKNNTWYLGIALLCILFYLLILFGG